MDKKSFIRVNNLKKEYKMGDVVVEALKGASFEIEEGEFVVILGPSGSGKSTLLNLIGGMDSPSEGSIMLSHKNVTKLSEKKLTSYRRDEVGFVFQFYNLMANLTAKENVELATEICKNPLPINDVMKSVNLLDRIDHFPSQMSGGEQQRVAIARAVAKNPKLLLCDEPTGALDFNTGISILSLLSDVNKKYNKTVMVITHNSGIAKMANRVIKMRSGIIIDNYINDKPVSPEGIEW
ncbi:ABC transporter ATP-binding protein [Helicovermis profundi]|uniref:ABC transporter ATP-binding protein n=1 Tax=Helicovermis profundi TaxID=3065157 RepID=A0AAU9E5T2_9FIRM|nr:ABC transporter ATP-binding protein [Clostridia bacterium S502]